MSNPPGIKTESDKDIPVSFWQAYGETPTTAHSLMGDIVVDVAVIGGGFTGLSTAREIRSADQAQRVVVLEGNYVGYGASGRNGGFNMSLFGLEPELTMLRWGKEKTIQAQNYMKHAVHYVQDLVRTHDLKSDYQHTGMYRVAYSDAQLKRLVARMELFEKLGIADQFSFKTREQIREDVGSKKFQAAIFEAGSGILNPYKHVRELKRLAENAGAEVFENTPVTHVARNGQAIKLTTPNGTVTCKKLVIAVNAWSGFIQELPKIRSRQVPVWTAQVVTAPLSQAQWDEIGWAGRQSIEDNRQLLHYFRRTVCGRITMGGGNVILGRGKKMGRMDVPKIWNNLECHLKWLFPALKNITFDYHWGGPVSINMDMTPEIGFIGDERVIYASGCIGHGVSLTQLNGRTIADLILEKKTNLTDFWIVNRKAIRWPPGPLGSLAFNTIKGGLKLWDAFEERNLTR